MLIQDIKCGIRVLLLQQCYFTVRKYGLKDISNLNTSIFKIIDLKVPLSNEQKSHFQLTKMPKMNIVKHSRN